MVTGLKLLAYVMVSLFCLTMMVMASRQEQVG